MRYRYFAFISYSSKDKVWAQWLHHQLETYKIPRALVGKPGRDGPIPKTLFPIFRDREELPLSSDLGNTIRDALDNSACLIVICSQSAAKSRWVNKEIETFKVLGKEDRIFALILDGEPNAIDTLGSEHLECFPQALRHHLAPDGTATGERAEPIGGDLRKGGDGQTKALQKAIAGVLGIGFNAIAQRELIRQRFRYAYIFAAVLLIAVLAYAYWDFTRTKTTYFRETPSRFGVPTGLEELDEETRNHLALFYRVESSKNKARKIFRVNSQGSLFDDANLFSSCEEDILYKEDGHIDYVIFKDHNGKINGSEIHGQRSLTDPTEVVDVKNASGQPLSVSERLDINGQQTTAATAFQFKYDQAGHLVEREYLNNYHSPTPDGLNIWSTQYQYPAGSDFANKVIYCGPDGQPSPDRNGVESITIETDKSGLPTSLRNCDADGKRVLTKEDYYEARSQFDRWGNLSENSYFDTAGKLTLVNGMAKSQFVRDHSGNCIETDYFGTDGKPILKDGLAKLIEVYDSRGFVTETRSYGISGKPIIRDLRYWKSILKYDDRGNVISTRFYDLDDKPTFCNEGMARINDSFDDHGNITREDYFDTDGNPVLVKGVASILFLYNDRDQLTSESFLGTDGKPTLRDGSAKLLYFYDERGNKTQTDSYGVDGKPTINGSGYARIKYKFDDRGHKLETSYYGPDSDTINVKGISRVVSEYDDLGNEVLVCTYDKDGQPAPSDGYVRARYKYDALGRKIGGDYEDERGKPALCTEGWASFQWKLDQRSNILEERLMDRQGKPLSLPGVPAIKNNVYDERGNVLETAAFGPDGNPVINKDYDNSAKMVTKYNEHNREIETDYFGTDGKPILCGSGFATALYKYDDHGRLTEDIYMGVHGEPVLNKTGYHRTLAKYDDRGHEIEGLYYGIDDKPIVVPLAGARKVWHFDARGNMAEAEYFGIDGKPFEVNNAAKVMLIYSPSDQLIELDLYDKTGHLIKKDK